MSGEVTINWTPQMLRRFKVAYKKAVAAGKDEFKFDDYDMVTGYAKYLIVYLDSVFKKGEHEQ